MPTRQVVKTDKAPPPLPVYSQAIICNGMVYCSGQIALNPETLAIVEGGIADRTVRKYVTSTGIPISLILPYPSDTVLQKPIGRA